MTGTWSYVLSPITRGDKAVELSQQLWRKKLMPVGDISYKGRTLSFSPDYLARLVDAFHQHAYDQVPFQLAPGDNSHTNDPERTRGAIVDLELQPDGLYCLARVTPAGEAVLRSNPQLGVSARIVENYERADGSFFPAAIQHVLGTLDPRVPGMGPWSAIEASNYGDIQVLDLSGFEWASEVTTFPAGTEKLVPLLDLPDAEFDLLLAGLQADDSPGSEMGQLIAWAMADVDQHPEAYAAGLASEDECVALANQHDALGDISRTVELAYDNEAVRRYEDAQPLRRRTEDRLAASFDRIMRGSYRPASPFFEGAGGASSAGRTLARQRWQGAEAGSVSGLATCGPADDLGYCMAESHSDDCGSLAAGIGEVFSEPGGVYREIATQPWTDSAGRRWQNQAGGDLDITQMLEVTTGQQLMPNAGGPFDNQPRELVSVQRQARYVQDFDDPDDAGGPLPDVRDLAGMIGISPKDVAADRVRAGMQRDDAIASVVAHGGRQSRLEDTAFDMGSRRAAVKQFSGPISVAQFDGEDGEGLRGQPQYTTAGMIAGIRDEMGL